MATQNSEDTGVRSIVGAVQQRDASGKVQTFVAGQEEELNAVLPASQIERLVSKGVLSGEWTGAEPPKDESESGSGDETDSDELEGLPTLADLAAYLEGIGTAEDVKALRKTDKRKGAKPMYEARLAALKDAEG